MVVQSVMILEARSNHQTGRECRPIANLQPRVNRAIIQNLFSPQFDAERFDASSQGNRFLFGFSFAARHRQHESDDPWGWAADRCSEGTRWSPRRCSFCSFAAFEKLEQTPNDPLKSLMDGWSF
jgi:hypothetical protein